MVNVAGRSKACHTCRKRRAACTKERPECRQCVRLGYPCGGYDFQPIFVHVNNIYKTNENATKSTFRTDVLYQPLRRKKHNKSHQRNSPGTRSQFDQCQISSKPLYRRQLFQQFITVYFPQNGPAPESLTFWYALFPDLPSPTEALQTAMTALCAANLGQHNHDEPLLRQSWQYYTTGLHELQKALRTPDLQSSDETLAAAMALAMYELTQCPNDGRLGYVSHVRGLRKLLMLRGPHARTSPLSREVYRLFRAMETLHALENKEYSFLASEADWARSSWTDADKALPDQIIDVILSISSLLRDADNIWSLPPEVHPEPVYHLIVEYWKLDIQLLSIEQRLRERFSEKPMFWPVLSTRNYPTDDSVFGKMFPVVYHFPDLQTASTIVLLWTTLAMTRSALEGLCRYLRTDLARSGNEAAVELSRGLRFDSVCNAEGDWIFYARSACQCVEYFLQDSASGAARIALSLPLHILAGYLQVDPRYAPELKWIRDAMGVVGQKGVRLLLYW